VKVSWHTVDALRDGNVDGAHFTAEYRYRSRARTHPARRTSSAVFPLEAGVVVLVAVLQGRACVELSHEFTSNALLCLMDAVVS